MGNRKINQHEPSQQHERIVPSLATPLETLCQKYYVEDLGFGDSNQGINALVGMAITLANLAPEGSSVRTQDGSIARLGVNLLVTGSASASAISDEVVIEVGSRQKNIRETFINYQKWAHRVSEKPGATPVPLGKSSNAPVNALAEILSDIPSMRGDSKLWAGIMNTPPCEQFPDFALNPKLLVSASRPNDLDKQLKNLRPGRPLVHLGLARPADLSELADSGSALAEGRFTPASGDEPLRANLLITDPLEVLAEAAKAPSDRSAWLRHFIWLSDGGIGPEAPAGKMDAGSVEKTRVRFRLALDHIVTHRFQTFEMRPLTLPWSTSKSTARFNRFLNEMEKALPGIKGAARNLINSLTFGLHEMARIEKKLTISPNEVEALAQFIIRRMANTRTSLLHSGELARRRANIERIYRKLSQGPVDTRTIYKNLSMPANECHECLNWLKDAEFVEQLESSWHLIEGTSLSFTKLTNPTLEV